MTSRLHSLAAALALGGALLLTGCTNWLIRKDCEKVNWFDHGHQVAMSGKRLTGDALAEKCRKAEFELPEADFDRGFKSGMAEYCRPEVVTATGKKGDFFNPDMCDPGQASTLKKYHAEGVKQYCAVENGYSAGASGKKYQNICPTAMESAFLKEYNRGRRKYLSLKIEEGERASQALDSKITGWEREKLTIALRMNLLPRARDITETVYNQSTGTYVQQTRTEDPGAVERQRLQNELSGIDRSISGARTEQDSLRKQITSDKVELGTLE